ncbi:MAG: hypothetical protein FD180_619 [Planctomycetota bacterium]|nr:MAG: hypothetical protein FD180_619 [Planctomycetota bacterium]
MRRTTYINSPEFARIRAHVLVTVTAWGALMLVALKVQFNMTAWADDASPVTIASEHDRTPAVQSEFYGELLKRASAGLPAPEKLGYGDMMDRPAELRGKVVRWEGVILGEVRRLAVEPVPLAPGEAPPEVSKSCEATVMDPVSGKTVAVTFLEPGPQPAAHGRIVFDGAFWKIATYPNQRGDVKAAPYLVAKTWTLSQPAKASPVLPILMGLTGGLAIASIVIGAGASRRKDACKSSSDSAK